MTSLIRIPFASSGDKTAVPETDAGGSVNMTQGYGQAYALDPATDPSAKRIEREKMNGLFNFITSAIAEIQASGCVPFITADDNGGAAYSYNKRAMTILDGVVYQSLTNGNVTTPLGASWATLANLSNALSRSNPFGDIKSDGTVDTAFANLGLGSGAKLSAAVAVTATSGRISIPAFVGGVERVITLQWVSGFQANSSGVATVTLPLAFPNALLYANAIDSGAASNSWNGSSGTTWGVDLSGSSKTTVVARVIRTTNGTTWSAMAAAGRIFSIGY
ncbi:Uncharacterised protein [Enterobacter kobei]|uniref:gp53-like domain-containing protein n=3 Tax=Enterobacter kobei TaxID=208224 RepID=UPI00125464CE|nr:hypothetical protein [Enterobacter kobei]VAL40164.1 Uncharacterised protein [Enterobacter kobei]